MLAFVKRKKPSTPIPIAYIPLLRPSKRPTVEIHQFDGPRIQEAILGVFKTYNYKAIDLDALIYFALQAFEVVPTSYEYMAGTIRTHIMKHFAIEQGAYRPTSDVHIRRVVVCYTVEKGDE